MNQGYCYETHLHTCEVSACATCAGADYPKKYQELGYAGIIVTDHFFNGNTRIDRNLPWKKRVNEFCRGYEAAKEAGDQIGFDVFFGWEHNFRNDEYLIYGLDKTWLLSHPKILEWNQRQLYNEVHNAGGLMIQAHPFRMRNYISVGKLYPENVDGIEAFNGGNTILQDQMDYWLAKQLGIRMTAGTDIHHENKISQGCFGVELPERMTSIKDYVAAILGDQYTLRYEAERRQCPEQIDLNIPFYQYDQNGILVNGFAPGSYETEPFFAQILRAYKE